MTSNVGNFNEKIPKQRGRCTSCLCMSWKVFTCILSHVILITCVIGYCLMGSYAFEWLEAENERQVRRKKKTLQSLYFVTVTQYAWFIFKSYFFFAFLFWQMKSEVKYIRGNLSLDLLTYTQNIYYLNESEWSEHALHKLLDFEKSILDTMKIRGWDGVENPERLQWTRMGALFYSIIVITTIGNNNFVVFISFFYFIIFSTF